jgi:hypothetical protein
MVNILRPGRHATAIAASAAWNLGLCWQYALGTMNRNHADLDTVMC